MKKGLVLGVAGILAVQAVVHAESSSEVRINNNVNTTNSDSTSSNTRVEITTNGETKVFESTGESIDYQSEDGKTSVRINSNGTVQENAEKTIESVKDEVKGAVDESKKEVEATIQKNKEDVERKASDEVKKQGVGLIEIIKNFFLSLFS